MVLTPTTSIGSLDIEPSTSGHSHTLLRPVLIISVCIESIDILIWAVLDLVLESASRVQITSALTSSQIPQTSTAC